MSLRYDQSHAGVLFAGEVMKSTLNFLIRNEVTKECYVWTYIYHKISGEGESGDEPSQCIDEIYQMLLLCFSSLLGDWLNCLLTHSLPATKVTDWLPDASFYSFHSFFLSYLGNSDATSPEDDEGTETGDNSIVKNYFDTTGDQSLLTEVNVNKDEDNENNLLLRMLEDEEDSIEGSTIIAAKRIITSVKVRHYFFSKISRDNEISIRCKWN